MSVAEFPAGLQTAPANDRALQDILKRQRAAFLRDGPPSARERQTALDRLKTAILSHQDDLVRAIDADFGNRSRYETLLAEVFTAVNGIRHARSHLKRWMRPQSVSAGWQFRPGKARIVYQPLGVVGIIGPWNYPFQLAILPLVGALAAGNRVMIKPSELTPRTAAVTEALLAGIFPAEQVAVVQGGPAVGEAFSRLPFDHLLYTGSTRVGFQVMRAAAENLTPVTLELGGKSPAILGVDYPVDKAALSIATGKLFNGGQTCIAPDYALVPADRLDAFVAATERAVRRLYPRLADNPDYTSIVNERHFERLAGYLAEARSRGARVVEINPADETLPADSRKLPPTLVVDPDQSLAVMQEEIFGPVLPVVTYRTLDEALAYVNARPRPLALYYFGHSRADQETVLSRTVSGGVTINDTLTHFAVESLPFGGVGHSGMGAYHGIDGFLTFSKKKGVFVQSPLSGAPLLRPPFGRTTERMLRMLIGH